MAAMYCETSINGQKTVPPLTETQSLGEQSLRATPVDDLVNRILSKDCGSLILLLTPRGLLIRTGGLMPPRSFYCNGGPNVSAVAGPLNEFGLGGGTIPVVLAAFNSCRCRSEKSEMMVIRLRFVLWIANVCGISSGVKPRRSNAPVVVALPTEAGPLTLLTTNSPPASSEAPISA